MGPFGSMDQTGRQGTKMAKGNKFFNMISKSLKRGDLSSSVHPSCHGDEASFWQVGIVIIWNGIKTSIQYMSQFHQVGFNVQVCCATVRPKRWLPTDRWHSEFTPASRHIRINDTFVFRNGFQVRLRRSYEAQRRIIQQQWNSRSSWLSFSIKMGLLKK